MGISEQTFVDMTVHHVEAALLEVEVGIDVDDRVVAYGDAGVRVGVLKVIHAEARAIGGCIVGCEIANIAAQLDAQHFSIGELQIEIAVDIDERQGEYIVATAVLRCHLVVPMQDAEGKVLIECSAQYLDVAAILAWSDVVVESRGA